jgi:histidinol-phosphate aminotransferase
MQVIAYPQFSETSPLLARPPQGDLADFRAKVALMLDRIRTEGTSAVRSYAEQFDGLSPDAPLAVDPALIAQSGQELSTELRQAIEQAYVNIQVFHSQQLHDEAPISTMPGVICWRKSVGIERVGLYIPGGTAPLFSTVLMLGVPAQLAGCQTVILCTPPQKSGGVHPAIRYAAHLCGIRQIFQVGGAQAIGAMAYGVADVPQVWKIFGPGNPWVTAAKQLVSMEGVAIDMPAGPSEVAVIADQTAYPSLVAADLLSQAEHGADSQVLLITTDPNLVPKVQTELQRQLALLPRSAYASAALVSSRCIIVKDLDEAMRWSNAYAPEHLILSVTEPEQLAAKVINAGSVFLGHLTPESAGDYASGTNHTLPTSGFARAYSGVSLDSFVKKITFQRITPEGLRAVGPTVEAMAEAEGLQAHAQAIRERYLIDYQDVEMRSAPLPTIAARLLVPHLLQLKPYSSARDEAPKSSQSDTDTRIWLDANENSLGDPLAHGYHRYPGTEVQLLRSRLADLMGVTVSQTFLGSGSDEPIDLLIRAFCVPDSRDHIIIMPPTYGMYSVVANIANVKIRTAPLKADFMPDIEAVRSVIDAHSKVLFLCSPNNPTGQSLPTDFVQEVLETFKGLVVVDEAYGDFATQPSWAAQLEKYPNLIVLRTLSKAWGSAGLRIGMALGDASVIELLNKIKYPYNVPVPSAREALQVLDNQTLVQEKIGLLLSERDRLSGALRSMTIVKKVHPSDANFLLVEVTDANAMYKKLAEQGIIVRNRTHELHCHNCLRITIGKPAENDRLIEVLKSEALLNDGFETRR